MNNTVIKCQTCTNTTSITNLDSWGAVINGTLFEELYCPKCAETQPRSKGVVILGGGKMFAFDEPPMKGNFKPVKSAREIKRFRNDGTDTQYWTNMETTYREILSDTEARASAAPFYNREFAELEVEFIWSGDSIRSLSFTGDRPDAGQWLNIYQQARLGRMGLKEVGTLKTNWILDLTEPESNPENIVRIMSHVLQFGYLLQPHLLIVQD
jgi:hypothetical protein